jgi:hypothetical protein
VREVKPQNAQAALLRTTERQDFEPGLVVANSTTANGERNGAIRALSLSEPHRPVAPLRSPFTPPQSSASMALASSDIDVDENAGPETVQKQTRQLAGGLRFEPESSHFGRVEATDPPVESSINWRPPARADAADEQQATVSAAASGPSTGMNAPAAIPAHKTASQERSSGADFKIRAPSSPAVVSFRATSEQSLGRADDLSWSQGTPTRNPLRAAAIAAPAVFVRPAVSPQRVLAADEGDEVGTDEPSELNVPANPLR